MIKKVVFIDGVRTPFLKSGTDYMDLMSYQLGQFAIKGLLDKTGIDPNEIDRVILGNVISNVKTENVAREAAVTAGVPIKVPANTVKQACISANQAISNAMDAIQLGRADVIISGGTECTSDTPIGYTKEMRKKLFMAQKLSTPMEYLKFATTLRPNDFLPDKPAVAEYITGRTMGNDCEILAQKFGVTREEQDILATASHQNAAKAFENGNLDDIISVQLPPKFGPINKDNGVRGDSTVEKMAKLKPAFDKYVGTITAANASFLTDGASAVLLASEEKALALGLKPKAELVDYIFTAGDLFEELLLGPAYSIAALLKKNNLTIADIDVWEIHEAFAGQVLANLKALESEEWSKKNAGYENAVGSIPRDKINTWGGSLSIGHPFGATGGRLLTMAANRLQKEGGKYAILAACAAGAHGTAMLIKKY
ncbi:MAG: thiolase family protein [Bacteroidetes bacterium]|nr:thiolase family protein [Bacteroidota bacterium]MBK9635055.1 thiolase family protein [Bacteroidota bacterium]MBL0079761.1 thiolase family protein [Bacteroidota bacterium]MBP7257547.1 thiolase family protein [Chitinophagales bacterium]